MPPYATIKQSFRDLTPAGDTAVEDINGRAVFTPAIAMGEALTYDTPPATLPSHRVTAKIVDGELVHFTGTGYPTLWAGDDGHGVVWRVTYEDMTVSDMPTTLNGFNFYARPGEVVDLSTVMPVVGSHPPGVTRGRPGRDGIDGTDGQDGAPGRDGIDGKDGLDGEPGRDGIDGKDGLDGEPGRDGIDGTDGQDGAPGEVTQADLDARVPADLAMRLDTTVGTRVFAGNHMIHGDTGWIDVRHLVVPGLINFDDVPGGGRFNVRRENDRVSWQIRANVEPALQGTTGALHILNNSVPNSLRESPAAYGSFGINVSGQGVVITALSNASGVGFVSLTRSGPWTSTVGASGSYYTNTSWPAAI